MGLSPTRLISLENEWNITIRKLKFFFLKKKKD
jgi:hypothetical protein